MTRSAPRGLVGGGMVVGVVAISTSAILARYAMGDEPGVTTAALGAAPALAVAFWRCALGAAALVPLAVRHGTGPVRWTASRRRQLVGSGVALGLHFALFQGSLALTTVASAVTLATMSPIFVAVGAARFLGEPAGRRTLIGMAVTIAGAILIGAGDLTALALGPRALTGDAMAFGSAVAVAGYLLVGRAVRHEVPATAYSAVVYAVAAAALLVVCLALQVPLVGYTPLVWAAVGGIVVGPQLLGHTVFNALLSHVPATVVSIVVLAEPVGAALLAWLLLDELPAGAFVVGAPLVLAGVATAVLRRRPRVGPPAAPVS